MTDHHDLSRFGLPNLDLLTEDDIAHWELDEIKNVLIEYLSTPAKDQGLELSTRVNDVLCPNCQRDVDSEPDYGPLDKVNHCYFCAFKGDLRFLWAYKKEA